MRPLPRLLAYANDRIASLDDLGVRAAAIAAAGPAVALVARHPSASIDALTTLAQRFVANATPPMAATFVTGRIDVALAARADGVILRAQDLEPSSVRPIAGARWIFRSVHSLDEARTAVENGADALVVGTIWESTSHPDQVAAGTDLLREVVTLGVPAYAIGGVTVERAAQARDAGAWGVAAIGAVWDAPAPYRAAMEVVQLWT